MRVEIPRKTCFQKAYVVFEDNTTLAWLKVLKKGFRHCYLLLPLEGEGGFMELNPMSDRLFIGGLELPPGCDYIRVLRARNLTRVCEAPIQTPPAEPAPLGLFTCVEFVKRGLGLHRRGIFTPYQLYKYLARK